MQGVSTRILAACVLGEAVAGVPPSRGVLLRILAGAQRGRIVPVAPGDVVGRSAAAQVTLPDAAASRAHARLERHRSGYGIVDLASKNGVTVNGRRVRARAALRDGDRIIIGTTELEVSISDAELAPGLASPAAADAAAAGGAQARRDEGDAPVAAARLKRHLHVVSAAVLAVAAALLAIAP